MSNKRCIRHFNCEGIANFRDLGGLPCHTGYTRYGVFFRSSHLNRMSENDLQYLKECNIKFVMDLRYSDESKNEPDRMIKGIKYKNISLLDPVPIDELNVKTWVLNTKTLFYGFYKKLLDRSAQSIKNVLIDLIWEDDPSIFHCASGKDRTGLIAMFLCSMVGVSEMDLIADYSISHILVKDFTSDISGSNYINMVKIINYLKHKYGGVNEYLKKIGISDNDFEHLKKKFVF